MYEKNFLIILYLSMCFVLEIGVVTVGIKALALIQ
jgi:hypothetical protein